MESVMLDTVADAAAAIGVALLIALVVGYHAIRLMRKVLTRLREPQVLQERVRRDAF